MIEHRASFLQTDVDSPCETRQAHSEAVRAQNRQRLSVCASPLLLHIV
jgi:hypothetical protein